MVRSKEGEFTMNADLFKIYELSIYTYIIEKNNITIVCNTGFGTYLKIPTECWKVIEKYVGKFSPKEICESAHKEDREYFSRIFDLLIEKRILVLDKEWLDTIDLAITNRCNLQCAHCAASAEAMSAEEILTTQDWYNIIDKVLAAKPNLLVLTGGEPLVRGDFFEITRYIRANYKGKLELMTNGLKITNRNVMEIVNTFDIIAISLDGYDEETCAAIRGKGVFKKVLDTIELLINNGFERAHLSLSMVETEITYGNTYKFAKLCNELGIGSMIRGFSAIGRGRENKDWLALKSRVIKDSIEEKEEKDIYEKRKALLCQNCRAGRGKIFINYEGNIFPCQLLDNEKYCFGNILRIEDLSKLIIDRQGGSEKGFDNYEQLLIKNNTKCSKCDVAPFCKYCAGIEMYDENNFESTCEQRKRLIADVLWGA